MAHKSRSSTPTPTPSAYPYDSRNGNTWFGSINKTITGYGVHSWPVFGSSFLGSGAVIDWWGYGGACGSKKCVQISTNFSTKISTKISKPFAFIFSANVQFLQCLSQKCTPLTTSDNCHNLLAKEKVAGSIPVSRSFLCPKSGYVSDTSNMREGT